MHLLAPLSLLFATITTATLVPGPPGPYAVALKVHPLTDTSRPDPLDPTGTSKARRLLISMYLPVELAQRPRRSSSSSSSCPVQKVVSYMTPPVAASYGEQAAQVGLPSTLYEQFEMEFCDLSKLSPCGKGKAKKQYPLIVFGPGLAESRLMYGAMARSLASHGYIVVSVDHPFEAPAVEFPDGTVVTGVDIDPTEPGVLAKLIKIRTDDISFILNQLHKPSIINALLADYPGAINYKKLAAYGHSFGGCTAVAVAHADTRILGGLNLDGQITEPLLLNNTNPNPNPITVTKPIILAGRKGHSTEDPTWNQFWPQLKGQRMEIGIANTTHGAFKDFLTLLSTLNLPEEVMAAIQGELGTIEPRQLDATLNGLLVAFFDLLFSGKKTPLISLGRDYAGVSIVRSSL